MAARTITTFSTITTSTISTSTITTTSTIFNTSTITTTFTSTITSTQLHYCSFVIITKPNICHSHSPYSHYSRSYYERYIAVSHNSFSESTFFRILETKILISYPLWCCSALPLLLYWCLLSTVLNLHSWGHKQSPDNTVSSPRLYLQVSACLCFAWWSQSLASSIPKQHNKLEKAWALKLGLGSNPDLDSSYMTLGKSIYLVDF